MRGGHDPHGAPRAAVNLGPGAPLVLPSTGGRLGWSEIFGRTAPIEVEVGCGKGRYLLEAASARPGHDFLGIEIKLEQLRLCAGRALKRGLRNVRVIRSDASLVLWERIPGASLAAVHIYYPDPWWKARHRKRRLVTAEFLADAARALAPGGELRVATDVTEYYSEILALVRVSGLFDEGAAAMAEFGTPEKPLTSFQAKYLPLGRPVHGMIFRRGTSPAPATPDPRIRLRLARERKRAGRG